MLIQRILNVSEGTFDALALDIFGFQYTNNALYRQYCDLLASPPGSVSSLDEIPFLPIRFFKSHRVVTRDFPPALTFRSSGTTGRDRSSHAVRDPQLYERVSVAGFEHVFEQPVAAYRWLALLPSYLERPDASLVHMVSDFIKLGRDGGGFYLNELASLDAALEESEQNTVPAILMGVSFALLAFSRAYPRKLRSTRIIETGGMKGRSPEITREALHRELSEAFGLGSICSEYGMTELLSQAWSVGEGRFQCSPTLRVLIRDLRDPFAHLAPGKRGGIDCIDLANLDSCAFVQTEDVGMLAGQGDFYVAGRLDGSEARGCNLLLFEG